MDRLVSLAHSLAVLILVVLLLGPSVTAGLADAPTVAWQTEIADVDGGVCPSLALDSNGWPHISYGGNEAGTFIYGLKYAYYDGSAWQIEMVDDHVSPGWKTSLAMDSLDEPHIAYHDPHEALMYAHYYNSSWHIQTVDSGGDVGEHASLELDSTGMPSIAYTDETNHALKYARRSGATWQKETVVALAGSGQSISLDLAMDAADHPHLCYYDYDADVLYYAHHDGATWHFDPVAASVFYNGQDCALALDREGHPHIAYVDLGLWYAYFDGVDWQSVEIGNEFGLSRLSLALNRADRPYIAYAGLDYPDYPLRYAYFDGFDWQVENADMAASPSRYEGVSLALDEFDRPRIAYQDLHPDDLKYATKGTGPLSRVYLPLVVRQQ